MHEYEELKEMLKKELKDIIKQGELSAGSLDVVDKLTHSLKSVETIIAMEGSSHRSSYNSYGGSYNSYGSYGRDGDGDGRYSEARYSYDRGSYDNSYRYSRDGAKDAMVKKLMKMADEPMSENDRLAIMNCIEKIK